MEIELIRDYGLEPGWFAEYQPEDPDEDEEYENRAVYKKTTKLVYRSNAKKH
jgi:hypothetical protein